VFSSSTVRSLARVSEKGPRLPDPGDKRDVLLSLEPAELVRAPEFLGLGTRVVMSTAPVYPIPVMLNEALSLLRIFLHNNMRFLCGSV
jgi:hypothetical protein